MFISGLNTTGVLVYNGREINKWIGLPQGTHNARPHRDGVLYNDTRSDRVCFETPTRTQSFKVPTYPQQQLTNAEQDDTRVARQGFGRGLCAINDQLIAAGSSPSTITLHDLDANKSMRSVTLSFDLRNAIHGLELWPYTL